MNDKILEGLTPEQCEAVTYIGGPLLVVAGAGSGKTRVITRRVAWLVESGVSPFEILGITFTNKAAKEMRERILKWVDSPRMWLYTFHSTCARILRREIYILPPFDANFSIIDETDRASLMRDVCDELQLDLETYKPGILADEVSRIKNCSLSFNESIARSDLPHEVLERVFNAYNRALMNANSLDFDDLLLKTVEIFEREPKVLERYRRRFQQVLVDEYQDTNPIQNRFLSLLCAPDRNICATGDPDQAIYGWRGADIANILGFENEYKNAKRVTLAKNFRSTNSILKLANNLIANNKLRYSKNLYSDFGEGEKPMLLMARDEEDEASSIARRIRELINSGFAEPSDCAILFRVNAQSRAFEESCLHTGIPYALVGAVAFFRRKEIKDIAAYLRVLVNPADSISLLRIINRPTRGIGPSTVDTLQKESTATNRPVFDLIADSEFRSRFPKRAAFHLEGFCNLLNSLSNEPRKPVAQLMRTLLDKTGYGEQFNTKKRPDDIEQIANIGQFVNDAARFDDEIGGDLQDFLQQIALVSDVDNLEETSGSVTLMTFHAAKGLEFNHVFLSGLEESVLPHERSRDSDEQLEEERRLFYVGITRARKTLTISSCMRRRIYGEYKDTRPSRFLRESELLSVGGVANRVPVQPRPIANLTNFDIGAFRNKAVNAESQKTAENNAPADEMVFQVGDIIEHAQFGPGKVEEVSGRGPNSKLRIFFRHYGVKTLVLEYARPNMVLKKRH